ncbi:hypothetical protein G7062_00090 [Erysipelothrix sp. HDW6C]|uniref:hypothetical protein n=1 Tax=Erysipelothrix sp. HDW6C TaxID=2714930 RepID=UPI00140E8D94|nr:hypothetical protein [Erysipelothrix sp. HDW6C]QIK68774.1 hypothetical protein G7062_00090 [Erysipelothrix sp. HDW6C]
MKQKKSIIVMITLVVIIVLGAFWIHDLTQPINKEPSIQFRDNIVIEYGYTTSGSGTTKEIQDGIKNGTIVQAAYLNTEVHVEQIVDFQNSSFKGYETADVRLDNKLLTDEVSFVLTKQQKIDYPLNARNNEIKQWIWDTKGDTKPLVGSVKITLDDGREITETFEYLVVDTTAPMIIGAQDLTTERNVKIKFEDFIKATDYFDGPVEISIDGEIKWNEAGIYDVMISATDKNGLIATELIKVTVQAESTPTS